MKVSYKLGAPAQGLQSFQVGNPAAPCLTRRCRREREMFSSRTWSGFANDLEGVIAIGFIGLFTTGLVSMSFIALLVLTSSERRRVLPATLILLWFEWVVIATFGFRGFEFIITALGEAPRPRPANAALRQRFRWMWLRVTMGFWWIANALGMIAMAEVLIAILNESITARDQLTWEYRGTVFLIFFGCSYAANTFVLLAAATVRRRRSFLLKIWRLRVVLDVGCALLAVSANQFISVSDWYLR